MVIVGSVEKLTKMVLVNSHLSLSSMNEVRLDELTWQLIVEKLEWKELETGKLYFSV